MSQYLQLTCKLSAWLFLYFLIHVCQIYVLKVRKGTNLFNSKMLLSCVGVYILILTWWPVLLKLLYVFILNNCCHFLNYPVSRCTIQCAMHELCLSLHVMIKLMIQKAACIKLRTSLNDLNHVGILALKAKGS